MIVIHKITDRRSSVVVYCLCCLLDYIGREVWSYFSFASVESSLEDMM